VVCTINASVILGQLPLLTINIHQEVYPDSRILLFPMAISLPKLPAIAVVCFTNSGVGCLVGLMGDGGVAVAGLLEQQPMSLASAAWGFNQCHRW